ncbi:MULTISPECIES: ribosome maturation factor RimM [unclassified Phycicoccus]|uniref:ribosome maturation factor RimM n=1 Tax=unclassified Phycicoccus TaxID=2637926 RepID=UPI000702B313|nr:MULTISPECIES: ribosome maturation factor RimM [unclassified Phycicoccus]KQU70585.1 ribosome maturation factor RimM [Phycicoccus sp. Root101]KQZ88888.1 ribosome maturation factor RimM [Phycicoccus sp. Root563]
MPATDQLLVARIGKPHGLRGEVTVQAHTDDPERRFIPGVVFATEAPEGSGVPRALTLATARLHQKVWLLGFEQIPDRTGAEGLRGTRLFVALGDVIDAVDDDEDGWYEDELVGLTVVDTAGATVGEVAGLETGAAQDLLVVTLTGGRQALVPFVEAIVPEVDMESRRVVIDPPPGLLELADE